MSLALLDLILAGAVVWLAWMALAGRDLFRSVVLFIVFGLVMALIWARLRAPDIALAEAAIGAGLTGALLLDAAGQLGGGSARRAEGSGRATATLAALAVLGFGGVFALALHAVPSEPGGLAAVVAEQMPLSGVDHPTTAVLLNFRAFDTWLELAVLLVAVQAALIIRGAASFQRVDVAATADPVLAMLPRTAIPLMLLVGGYLLWLGTHAPGGAFQAGAVFGSAGVLLMLAGRRSVAALTGARLHLPLLAGVVAFWIVAAATALGGPLLQFPPGIAGPVILVIEVAATISIAVTLALLFAGARMPTPAAPPPRREGR